MVPLANISGPSQQAEIHIDCNQDGDTYFAYVSPDRGLNGWNSCVRLHHVDMRHVDTLRAILEMMQEKEPGDEQPGPAVTCEQFEPLQQPAERQPAHQLHQRGEDVLYIAWWLMMSEGSSVSQLIRDMTANCLYQDKQDMRQEVALRAWIRHIRAEQQGKRAVINGIAVRRLVQQWLEREGKAEKPVDAEASPEDAAKAKEAIDQERAVKRLEDWRHEVARLRAMAIQAKPPAASLIYTW